MTAFQQHLEELGACQDVRELVGQRSAAEAWVECERADWLLWWAARDLPHSQVVRAACACARRALRFVPAGELRPLLAIEAAERWVGAPTEGNRAAALAAAAAATQVAIADRVAIVTRAAAAAAAAAARAVDRNNTSSAAAVAKDVTWAADQAATPDVDQAAAVAAEDRALCSLIRKMLPVPWTEQRGRQKALGEVNERILR